MYSFRRAPKRSLRTSAVTSCAPSPQSRAPALARRGLTGLLRAPGAAPGSTLAEARGKLCQALRAASHPSTGKLFRTRTRWHSVARWPPSPQLAQDARGRGGAGRPSPPQSRCPRAPHARQRTSARSERAYGSSQPPSALTGRAGPRWRRRVRRAQGASVSPAACLPVHSNAGVQPSRTCVCVSAGKLPGRNHTDQGHTTSQHCTAVDLWLGLTLRPPSRPAARRGRHLTKSPWPAAAQSGRPQRRHTAEASPAARAPGAPQAGAAAASGQSRATCPGRWHL